MALPDRPMGPAVLRPLAPARRGRRLLTPHGPGRPRGRVTLIVGGMCGRVASRRSPWMLLGASAMTTLGTLPVFLLSSQCRPLRARLRRDPVRRSVHSSAAATAPRCSAAGSRTGWGGGPARSSPGWSPPRVGSGWPWSRTRSRSWLRARSGRQRGLPGDLQPDHGPGGRRRRAGLRKQSAIPLSIMVAGLAVPTGAALVGWRATFVFTGVAGLLAALSASARPGRTVPGRRRCAADGRPGHRGGGDHGGQRRRQLAGCLPGVVGLPGRALPGARPAARMCTGSALNIVVGSSPATWPTAGTAGTSRWSPSRCSSARSRSRCSRSRRRTPWSRPGAGRVRAGARGRGCTRWSGSAGTRRGSPRAAPGPAGAFVGGAAGWRSSAPWSGRRGDETALRAALRLLVVRCWCSSPGGCSSPTWWPVRRSRCLGRAVAGDRRETTSRGH